MKANASTRLQYRLQSGVFVVLLIALLAVCGWLSLRFPLVIDLTANQRNSLSAETLRLLGAIEEPLEITLFVTPVNESRPLLEALFERYRLAQPRIRVRTLNPDLYPDLLREHDIRYDGEVLLEYRGRRETVARIDEAAITGSIQRLLRDGDRWLVFVEGHGEPHPYREANHDYSELATQLAKGGFGIETLNLTQSGAIADNTDVLLLANPRVPLLPGELDLLVAYVERGGNLLWLADPEQASDGIGLLADLLGIEFLPGIVVDSNSQLMGLDRPDFALVGDYPRHPVTQNLHSLSVFPEAQAIAWHGDHWQQREILQTGEQSWNETGPLRGEVIFGDDADEGRGPLTIGLTLARSLHDDANELYEQRIAVIGDADFLSNTYLGNGSNLDIGINLLNWLSRDDTLIAISPRPAPDTRLELSPAEQIAIALLFLIGLPLALLGSGFGIWYRRRKT